MRRGGDRVSHVQKASREKVAVIDPEMQERIEEDLVAVLAEEKDNIAISLGIPPQWAGEWTPEEAQRIVDEVDRKYRDAFTSVRVGSD